jgi:hypothetical protein
VIASEWWETFVPMIRGVWPGQVFDDDAAEAWFSMAAGGWEAARAQLAVGNVAAELERLPSLAIVNGAYRSLLAGDAASRPKPPEPSRDERRAAAALAARWLAVQSRMEAGDAAVELRRASRSRIGRPYVPLIERAIAQLLAERGEEPAIPPGEDGWNGRVRGGAGGQYPRGDVRLSPNESIELLEAMERIASAAPPPPPERGRRGLLPSMPSVPPEAIAREATPRLSAPASDLLDAWGVA